MLVSSTDTNIQANPHSASRAGWHQYGCRINAHEPAVVMQWYEQVGFLYPEKRKRLAPVLGRALDAWTRTLCLGDRVRRTCTFEQDGQFAAMDQWLSTSGTWTVQHLISSGGGVGSRATILAGLAFGLADPAARAWDCWFRMSNPMPRRVLATSCAAVGPESSNLAIHEVIGHRWDGGRGLTPANRVAVTDVSAADLSDSGALGLLAEGRGAVFLQAQDLEAQDPLLLGLDATFQAAGLHRSRQVLAAWIPGRSKVAGVALCHRGPVATNFSFLENRCDIVAADGLDDDDERDTVHALVTAAQPFYREDPPPLVPVVGTASVAQVLLELGGQPIQQYAHVTWLRDGLPALHDHFEKCFAALQKAPPPGPLADRLSASHPGDPQ